MGKQLFDRFTLLHIAVGVVMFYWNISFKNTIIFHTIFELLENTDMGVKFISTHIKQWPGGKPYADSPINMLGDTIGVALGWYLAHKTKILNES